MATTPSLRASRAYAAAQMALLAVYAAILLWNPGGPLFASASAAMAGNALAIAGLVVIALGFLALRGNIQVAPHTKAGAHLVQSGIYRVLRHPIYTGIAACVAGLWLREPTLAAAVAGVAVIAFLGVKRRVEERFLLAAYPGYAEYRTRTIAFP
ncbi:MAG TPA: methyltransferase [Usitatibacter sp.]|nr:methyltransferase [Usitatibacter sp.]